MKFASKIKITQIRGKDAIAVDENYNGELYTNSFRIPKEGYGFTSGAEVESSDPSFSEAEFSYNDGELYMTIHLNF